MALRWPWTALTAPWIGMLTRVAEVSDRMHSWLVPIHPSRDGLTSLPVNIFCNKLAPSVPNYMLENPSFCSFASFLIVLNQIFWEMELFFMVSFISLLEIINIAMNVLKFFFWIAVAVTEIFSPDGIKSVSTDLTTIFIKDKPFFNGGHVSLSKSLLIVLLWAFQFLIILY